MNNKHLAHLIFYIALPINLIFTGHSLAAEATNQPYENALKSFYMEDLNAAVIYLKNALKNNPSHLPSRILMAEILIARGDGAGAEIELLVAEKGRADNKKLLPLLLEAYLLQSKYVQVIKSAKPIANNNRLSSDILVFKARALFSKNNSRLARIEYQNALLLNPKNPNATLGLAQIALKKEQYQTSFDYLEQTLRISPLNTNAMQMKANLFQIKGDIKQAEAIISEAIAINSKHFPALLTRAGVFIEQGKFNQALEDINVILQDIPNEPRANYLKTCLLYTSDAADE